MKKLKQTISMLLTMILFCSCGDNPMDTVSQDSEAVSENDVSESDTSSEPTEATGPIESVSVPLQTAYKTIGDTNPISSNIFFADPTAVEYDGRLYVYGTCDTQQYKHNGGTGDNGYGQISSLSCFSTDDMKNWTYHGDIDVRSICKWAVCSWAPSIVSRETASGETEFFLYFCNSGGGIGVMKSNSPLGPWTDPVGHALLPYDNADLKADPVCWCFDPGVVIDDNGVGWLAFGGGDPMHSDESGLYTGNCRIVRLGADMTSIDSEVVKLPAPYHFEANELNYIGGKYLLTYCSNWKERNEWPDIYNPDDKPDMCTMCYMISDDPLNPDSWEYGGQYLKNPTGYGLSFSNNHTHLQKYGDTYYLLYQNVSLLTAMKKSGASGYRSIGVDELTVDEVNGRFSDGKMTKKGVDQLKYLDPYTSVQAETSNVTAGIEYECNGDQIIAAGQKGSWIGVVGVDFQDGASQLELCVKGKGFIELRLDAQNGDAVAAVHFDTGGEFSTVSYTLPQPISGVQSVFFVFEENDICLDSWRAIK